MIEDPPEHLYSIKEAAFRLGLPRMIEDPPEHLYSIKEAAFRLGLPRWKLYRAVKAGLIPSYILLNRRKLVRLSEVVV
jgi:excisionase family DNA binding protein